MRIRDLELELDSLEVGRVPAKRRRNVAKLFKVLVDGKSCHGGDFDFSLPTQRDDGSWQAGQWHEHDGSLAICERGFHLTEVPAEWWVENCTVYVAEDGAPDESIKSDNKRCCRKVRLLSVATEAELEQVQIFFSGQHEVKQGQAVALRQSRVEAWGSSSVVARGSSSVVAWGSSSVVARGSSSVVAWGSSRVEAWESSSVEVWGSSSVVAWESSRVVARGSSRVEAWGSSRVVARGSSSVEAWGSSRVEAWESSSVEAWGSSSVVAWGSSSVVARGSSSVEARGSSRVEAWGSSRVVARGSSTTNVLSGPLNLRKAHDHAILIDRTTTPPKITATWDVETKKQDPELEVAPAAN